MQPFSLIINKYTWRAKNLLSGKELEGFVEELPSNIAAELSRLISEKTVCITTTINIPNESEFSLWFNGQ